MTPQHIKDVAPEGATHYYDYPVIGYYKLGSDYLYVWFSHLKTPDWVAYLPIESLSSVIIKPL